MPVSRDLAGDVEVLSPRLGQKPGGGNGAQGAFSQHGPAGAPGCCLWCGRKLGLAKIANHPTITEHRGARGAYGDNSFCGLACGYQFGLQLAIFGRRLQVKPAAPSEPGS
jgi:hypothetical protein